MSLLSMDSPNVQVKCIDNTFWNKILSYFLYYFLLLITKFHDQYYHYYIEFTLNVFRIEPIEALDVLETKLNLILMRTILIYCAISSHNAIMMKE